MKVRHRRLHVLALFSLLTMSLLRGQNPQVISRFVVTPFQDENFSVIARLGQNFPLNDNRPTATIAGAELRYRFLEVDKLGINVGVGLSGGLKYTWTELADPIGAGISGRIILQKKLRKRFRINVIGSHNFINKRNSVSVAAIFLLGKNSLKPRFVLGGFF